MNKSVKSAICIIPPQEHWDSIQLIRRSNDKAFERWMPHVNLVYPFVPPARLAAAVSAVAAAVKAIAPFKASFARYGNFVQPKSLTGFVQPEPIEPFRQLNAALEKAFPDCDDLSTRGEDGFHPHLSLGQWGKGSVLERVLPAWKPFEMQVDRVYIIERTDDTPFEVRYEVRLGSGEIESFVGKDHPYNNKHAVLSAQSAAQRAIRKGDSVCLGLAHAYADGKWLPRSAQGKDASLPVSSDLPESISVLTWNLLTDTASGHGYYQKERTPLIIDELVATNPDIIALQEVNEYLLLALLSSKAIQDRYFVSSITQKEVSGPATMGQVVLAKFPFIVHCVVHSLNKRSLVCKFARDLTVCDVHLTCGMERTDDMTVVRRRQLNDVFGFTRPSIILGDFNTDRDEFATILPADYDDVWLKLHSEEDGITFNADKNAIANITSSRHVVQRLDRVLLKRFGTGLCISQMRLIGTQPKGAVDGVALFPSDHFGILSVFSRTLPAFDADAYLRRVATFTKSQEHAVALTRLSELFSEYDSSIIVLRAGSDAQSALTDDSDIDLCLFGSRTRANFFTSFPKFLRSKGFNPVNVVKGAKFPLVNTVVGSFDLDIHYYDISARKADELKALLSAAKCTVPNFMEVAMFKRVADVLKSTSSSREAVDPDILDAVNEILNLHSISGTINSLTNKPLYLALIQLVKKWAHNRGIADNKFGFVGGIGWCVMVLHFLSAAKSKTLVDVLREFFAFYAGMSFNRHPIAIASSSTSYSIGKYDHLVVLTPVKPVVNIARNSTKSSPGVLESEFKNALLAFERPQDLPSLFEVSFTAEFFSHNRACYYEVSVSADTEKEFRDWSLYIESRLIRAALRVEKDNGFVRVAPIGYVDNTYVIGRRYFLRATFRDQRSATKPAVLQQELTNDTTWKGKTHSMVLTVRTLKCEAIASLERDVLSTHLDEADDFNDNDDATASTSMWLEQQAEPTKPAAPQKRAQEKKKGAAKESGYFPSKHQQHPTAQDSKKKLRTSEDVFNRIKWDSRFDSSDFLIGYEDRFKGLLEVPFDDFDVENIPFHRIWVIKKNGEIVWDRENKIDRVFDDN